MELEVRVGRKKRRACGRDRDLILARARVDDLTETELTSLCSEICRRTHVKLKITRTMRLGFGMFRRFHCYCNN